MTTSVVLDPKWHLWNYLERFGTLHGRRIKTVASDGLILYRDGWRRVKHNTYRGAMRRRRRVFDGIRSVMLVKVVALMALLFVWYEKEVFYCRKLSDAMAEASTMVILK